MTPNAITSVAAETDFQQAAAQLRQATFRAEVQVREIAAPGPLPHHSVALSATVVRAGVRPKLPASMSNQHSEEADGSFFGVGRLILMHDQSSAHTWGSPFRLICFAQTPLEPEFRNDPFISAVAWSWLIDALHSRHVSYGYASGTATTTISTGFGSLEAQDDAAGLELRASWTPLDTNFAAHAEAWGELLCLLAGLPPHEGVAPFDPHRERA